MNIIESWKKQITFLQNKDLRTVFFIALKRYMHVLLSTTTAYIILGFLLVSRTYFLFSHQNYNLTHFSGLGLTKIFLSLVFFSIVLFLRPSTHKKDEHYLSHIIKKKSFMLLLLSFSSLIVPIILLFPFLFITSTILLLSVDGEYGIKNIINGTKKVSLFLIYNLPTLAIVSCINVASLIFFQCITAPYMQDVVFRSIALLTSALLFSLILLFTIFIFVFVYTVSIYENDRIFFDL